MDDFVDAISDLVLIGAGNSMCLDLFCIGISWSIMVHHGPSAMRSGETLAGFRPQRVPLMNLLLLKKTQDIPGSRKQQRKTCYNVSCGQNKVD
jgi:hypothetical protein